MLKNLINRWKTKWMLRKGDKIYKNRPYDYRSTISQAEVRTYSSVILKQLANSYFKTLHRRLDYNIWFDSNDGQSYTIIDKIRYNLQDEVNFNKNGKTITLAEAILPTALIIVKPLKEVVNDPEMATIIAVRQTYGKRRGSIFY